MIGTEHCNKNMILRYKYERKLYKYFMGNRNQCPLEPKAQLYTIYSRQNINYKTNRNNH